MSITVPKVIVEELRRRAKRAGASVDEYLLDLLTRDSDPEEAWRKYLAGGGAAPRSVREELGRGDLRQASEKLWGACALAVKAHALAKKAKKIESHAELWEYKDQVAQEIGEWIRPAFRQASLMHTNFYENQATKKDIEDVLREVKNLVEAISQKLKQRQTSNNKHG
ncbi:MAG: PaREP1 family protein [Aigarchaeota archaeon]|nr:PaREP1 family protein [Candidatus Pelearchaeum maunauluense]